MTSWTNEPLWNNVGNDDATTEVLVVRNLGFDPFLYLLPERGSRLGIFEQFSIPRSDNVCARHRRWAPLVLISSNPKSR